MGRPPISRGCRAAAPRSALWQKTAPALTSPKPNSRYFGAKGGAATWAPTSRSAGEGGRLLPAESPCRPSEGGTAPPEPPPWASAGHRLQGGGGGCTPAVVQVGPEPSCRLPAWTPPRVPMLSARPRTAWWWAWARRCDREDPPAGLVSVPLSLWRPTGWRDTSAAEAES